MFPHQHVHLPEGFIKPAGIVSIAQDTLLVADSSRIFAVQVFDRGLRVPCRVRPWVGGDASVPQQQVSGQQAPQPQQSEHSPTLPGNLLDGPACSALFTDIGAMAYDEDSGTLYVLDDGFIRKITVSDGLVPDTVTTLQPRIFADQGAQHFTMAVLQPPAACDGYPGTDNTNPNRDAPLLLIGHAGQITSLNLNDSSISGYAGTAEVGHRDGTSPDFAPSDMRFNGIAGLAVGSATTAPMLASSSTISGCCKTTRMLYVADSNNHCIRQIHTGGATTRVDTWLGLPGSAGSFGGSTAHRPSEVRLNFPLGICVDGDNQLFISDHRNRQVLQVDSCGTTKKLVPDVMPRAPELSSCSSQGPWQLAVTHQGHLAVMWFRQDMPACLCLYALGLTPTACSSKAAASVTMLRSDLMGLLESGEDADLWLQVRG